MDEIAEKIKEKIREMREERKMMFSEMQLMASRISETENRLKRMEELTKAMETLREDVEKRTILLQKKEADRIKKEVIEEFKPSIEAALSRETTQSYAEMKEVVLGIVQGGLEKSKENVEKYIDTKLDKMKGAMEESASKMYKRSLEEELNEVERVRTALKQQVFESLRDGLKETELGMKKDIERDVKRASREEAEEIRKDITDTLSKAVAMVKSNEEKVAAVEKAANAKLSYVDEIKLEEFVKAKELEEMRISVRDFDSRVSRAIEGMRSELKDSLRSEGSVMRKDSERLRLDLEGAMQDKIRSIGTEVKKTVSTIYEESEAMAMNYLKASLEAEVDRKVDDRLRVATEVITEELYAKSRKIADELLREKELDFKTAMASEINMVLRGVEDRLRKNMETMILSFRDDLRKGLMNDIENDVRKVIKREIRNSGVIEIVGLDSDK